MKSEIEVLCGFSGEVLGKEIMIEEKASYFEKRVFEFPI